MLTPKTRAEIEARALEIKELLDRRDGKYFAEIKPDCSAKWHLITTYPSKEDAAAEWLADRGIGVFVPRFAKGAVMRLKDSRTQCEEAIDLSDKLIFPGRILAFVWDVLAHWRRIKACPGVCSIMVDDRERPIVVSDAQVSKIQFLQFSLTPQPRRKRKRYRRSMSLAEESTPSILTISTKSYWSPDPEARIDALEQDLGISQP